MPNGDPSIEETLGTMSLLADTIPKHDSEKIDYGMSEPGGPGMSSVRGEERRGTGATGEESAEETDDDVVDDMDDDMDDDMADDVNDDMDDDADDETTDEAGGMRIQGGAPLPPRRPAPPRPVKPGSEEAFYLLATYCFDLQRKFEYLFRATRKFALKGDPALARELLRDEQRINANGLTWKQRAMRAEARMLELQKAIGPDHLRLLQQVAQRDRAG